MITSFHTVIDALYKIYTLWLLISDMKILFFSFLISMTNQTLKLDFLFGQSFQKYAFQSNLKYNIRPDWVSILSKNRKNYTYKPFEKFLWYRFMKMKF